MKTEPENTENNSEVEIPQDPTLQAIVTVLNRGVALFKIADEFTAVTLNRLQIFSPTRIANPNQLTVMDVYDRPVGEVRKLLKNQDIDIKTVPIETEDVFNLNNLSAILTTVKPNDAVELLVRNDRVVGMRVTGGRNDVPK